ncbi:type IX secretion system protein PorG [Spirosoma jeollabukense]
MPHYRINVARLVIAGLFISFSTQAQKMEVGGGLGGMLCKGDVSPTLNPRFYRPAGNLFFRYNATRSFSMRAGVAIGGLRGEDRVSGDPFQQARDYSYRTSLSEVTVDFEYNFFNYKPQPKVKNWSPYIFGGIGIVNFNNAVIKARGMLAFPLGIGIKYEIKRPWSVGVEFGTRFTNNDYLDGLGDRTFGVTNSKLGQGNPGLNDSYTYTALTVSYTFYKIFCP